MNIDKRIFNKGEAVLTISFEDKEFKMTNAFIGGSLNDSRKTPIGMFTGSVDVGDMGVALLTVMRTVLKTTTSEIGMSMEQSADFIVVCLAEALKREEQEQKLNHNELHDIVKKFMKNHF